MSPDWMTFLQSLSWDAAMRITLAAALGALLARNGCGEVALLACARI